MSDKLTVTIPFNTRLQRFSVGDEVQAGADLSPHSAAALIAAGCLKDPAARAAGGNASGATVPHAGLRDSSGGRSHNGSQLTSEVAPGSLRSAAGRSGKAK
jgi:hypothetical protein